MKNFRIPVMGLATCALLFTSCAKTISKQEAIDFVKANYTSTEPKTPTRKAGEFSGRAADDASKKYILLIAKSVGFFKVSEDNLSEKLDTTEGLTPGYVINADEIQKMPDNTEFKLKGKELITIAKASEEGTTGGYTTTYTSEGYIGSESAEISCKIDGVMDFSCTFNLTYTY